jgi:hypothetical protein
VGGRRVRDRQPRPARRAPPRVDIDSRTDPAQQCPPPRGGHC